MRKFYIKNILVLPIKLLLVLFTVSFLSFALIEISPIDTVASYVGQSQKDNLNLEELQRLEEYFGVNTPFLERYFNWLTGMLRGDLGTSLIYRQPVSEIVWEKTKTSFVLMMTSWILSGILGFALGVISGMYRDSWLDKFIRGYSLVIASIPTFWLAMVLLIIFSIYLNWLPIGFSAPIGVAAEDVTIMDRIRHLILPTLALSVTGIASITLHTREKMIEVMNQDYILYAKSRGEGIKEIFKHHSLRNVLIPAITLQFASLSEIIGGSVLVEEVFSYPGLGQAAVSSGLQGDAPLLLGIVMATSIMVFIGNMIANILYGVVDPRVRRGSNG